MTTRFTILVALLSVASWPGGPPVSASDDTAATTEASPAESVSFWTQVRPILQERCQGCHQPAKAGGKVILTSFELLMKGAGGEDPIVVPGEPDQSPLVWEITPDGDRPPSMPKEGKPLAAEQVALLRRWISEGARDDSPENSRPRYSMDRPPVYRTPPVVTTLDYSPDGSLLAVSGLNEVLLHRADGSELVARLVGLSERIETVVFSPDGKRLAVSGGMPGQMGEVQIWDVERRRLRISVPVTFDTVYGASWSPDGKLVAFGCADNSVRAMDAETGQQVLFQGAHNDWVLGTAFSADSSHLISVSRDRSAKLILVETEQFIDNITSITPGALKGGLMSIQRHPVEDQILVAGADGVPKIYRIFREKARKIGDDYNLVRAFEPMPGRVFAAEFNADATRIVAGSSHERRGEVRVYNVADGKIVWALPLDTPVYAVAFRPDGKQVAVGGFDGTVRLVDAATGKVALELMPVPLEVSS